jgi:hypothetical protein
LLAQAGGAFEPRAAAIYLWVEDVDATYSRASPPVARRTRCLPTSRTAIASAGVVDPNGVTW